MGSINADNDSKDDSGFAQDESMSNKMQICDDNYKGTVGLLDLSDDVLLYILKYCAVQDLKALGFSCSRLAALILDRTLWQRVDARSVPVGIKRMTWIMDHGVCADTTHILLQGFAKETVPCLMATDGKKSEESDPGCSKQAACVTYYPSYGNYSGTQPMLKREPCLECGYKPRCKGTPHGRCPGPKYTLNADLLKRLTATCPYLHTLELVNCNFDGNETGINCFPVTLKRLSLAGTKRYNKQSNKPFLFKVHEYLKELEEFDLSRCHWLEPSCLFPLSKMPSLKRLYMRRCPKMNEFVAYASLATRYGFNKLEVIDLRESPVGDSEVSSFGWLNSLLELYACPPPKGNTDDDNVPCSPQELEQWEEVEPDFFKDTLVDSKDSPNVGDGRNRLNSKDQPGPSTGDSSSKKDDDDDDGDGNGPPAKRVRRLDYIGGSDLTIPPNLSMDNAVLFVHLQRKMEESRRQYFLKRHYGLDERDDPSADAAGNAGANSASEGEHMKTNVIVISTRPVDDATSQSSNIDGSEVLSNDSGNINAEKADGNGDDKLRGNSDNFNVKTGTSQLHNVDYDVKDGLSNNGEISSSAGDTSEGTSVNFDVEAGTSQINNVNRDISKVMSNNSENITAEKAGTDGGDLNSDKLDVQAETSQSNVSDCEISDGLSNNCGSVSGDNTVLLSNSDLDDSFTSSLPTNEEHELEDSLENDVGDVKVDTKSSNHGDNGNSAGSSREYYDYNGSPPISVCSCNRRSDSDVPELSSGAAEDARVRELNGTSSVGENNVNKDTGLPPNVFIVPPLPENQMNVGIPRSNILFVNVGRRLHTLNMLMPNDLSNRARHFMSSSSQIEATSFVTDAAVYRFGHSDHEPQLNLIRIGRNNSGSWSRPNRSNLRVLSITGYRMITNRSLVHLATAAPHLRLLDFSRTNVTQSGVEQFNDFRPDCKVIWSEFTED